ncbi:type IV secretion system protein [Photobacterium damselae subsp. piscicida]|uniref:VirB8/TrbF family protein n=1 Tax=Photobacterium damselae TaxID=38293 RepID=UPI001075F478|nr:VirB8/TrbF family protein [Photobacterium damselae]TFZ62419.1 type IV secretion system protein [Photobacterium damselae subsp. piscicida]
MSAKNDNQDIALEQAKALSLLYQKGRQEWDERMGSAISQAHSWKMACFGLILVSLAAVGGIAYIGSQSKIVPYGVVLQNGEAIPIGPLAKMPASQINALHIKLIREFVEARRTVLVDVAAQKRLIQTVYSMLAPNTPALADTTRYYKSHNVFEQAQTELITVNVTSILPISDNTFQVEWEEKITSRNGQVLPYTKRFKATVNTFVAIPQNTTELNKNPLGFFIRTFNDVELK